MKYQTPSGISFYLNARLHGYSGACLRASAIEHFQNPELEMLRITADQGRPFPGLYERLQAINLELEDTITVRKIVDADNQPYLLVSEDDISKVPGRDGDTLEVALHVGTDEKLNAIRSDIRIAERLLDPCETESAYQELLDARLSEEKQIQFVYIAITSRKRYKIYRSIKRDAEKLLQEISEQSQALAKMVRQFRNFGIPLPDILRGTKEETFCPGRENEIPEVSELLLKRWIDRISSGPTSNNDTADIAKCLEAFHKATSDYVIKFNEPNIDSALISRQAGTKSEYVRGYAAALRAAGIAITPSLRNALAIVATIVIDEDETIVTEEDVRKALARTATYGGPA